MLGDLATARSVRRLAVPALSRAAVDVLCAPVGADGVGVYDRTGGSPFFVTEVLAAPEQAVPATVRDAVLARTARLSAAARATLDVAAVVPDRVEMSLLAAVGHTTGTTVDECVRAGILVGKGRYTRFRHELARVAVEQAIMLGRRAELHAAVLAHLEAPPVAVTQPATPTDPARLAYHAEEAGDPAAVLRYAPMAAERAAGMAAHREAADHFARAVRFADGAPLAEQAQLGNRLAEEYGLTGRATEAIDAATKALALWRRIRDPEREGVQLARLATWLWHCGRNAEAHATVREALTVLRDLPPGPGIALAYSTIASLLMLGRDLTGAFEIGGTAIRLAEAHGDMDSLARALNAVGTAQWFVEPAEAPGTLTRSLTVAREHHHDGAAAAALCNLGSGAGEVCRYEQAERWLREAITFSTERDIDVFRLYCTAWLARLCLEQGRWTEATNLAAQTLGSRPPTGKAGRSASHADQISLTVIGRLRARRGAPSAPGSAANRRRSRRW